MNEGYTCILIYVYRKLELRELCLRLLALSRNLPNQDTGSHRNSARNSIVTISTKVNFKYVYIQKQVTNLCNRFEEPAYKSLHFSILYNNSFRLAEI